MRARQDRERSIDAFRAVDAGNRAISRGYDALPETPDGLYTALDAACHILRVASRRASSALILALALAAHARLVAVYQAVAVVGLGRNADTLVEGRALLERWGRAR